MKPSKPHSFLRICVSVYGFAQPGTPLMALNEHIDRVGARVDRRLERRQVDVAQPLLGHVGRVVVAAALGLAVGGEVLGARDDLVGLRVVVALRGADAGRGHDRAEVRVLAGALGDPAPARLVRDVDHRAVDLLDAGRGRLARADRCRPWPRRPDRSSRPPPSGIGKIVRNPWIVSKANRIGMCSRDCSTADVLERVDLRRVGEAEHAADPLLRVGVGHLAVGQQLDLLSFSSSVIRPSSWSTRFSMFWSAGCASAPGRRGRRRRTRHRRPWLR